MGLILIDISKNANSITLRDDSTYGVAPTSVTLKWKYWTDEVFLSLVLSAEQMTAIVSAGGLVVTPLLIGIAGATTDSKFTDGEHHFQLDVDGVILDLKVLINKAAEACIVSAIGKLSERDSDCVQAEYMINKLIRWRFASDVKHDLKDYDGAHNLIVAVGKICCGLDCDCNNL